MERKSGSSFSPVLHPWLLKIRFLLKARCVFPADHYLQPSTNLCKTPGQESSLSMAFSSAMTLYPESAWAEKPSADEIMFFLVA